MSRKSVLNFQAFAEVLFLYKVSHFLYFTQNPSTISYNKRRKIPEPVFKRKYLRSFEQCVSRQNANAEHLTKKKQQNKDKEASKQKKQRKEATIKHRIMLQHFLGEHYKYTKVVNNNLLLFTNTLTLTYKCPLMLLTAQ